MRLANSGGGIGGPGELRGRTALTTDTLGCRKSHRRTAAENLPGSPAGWPVLPAAWHDAESRRQNLPDALSAEFHMLRQRRRRVYAGSRTRMPGLRMRRSGWMFRGMRRLPALADRA